MGNIVRRQKKKKSIMNRRSLLKKVWSGIADNPQYHGNIFFLGFCKLYPQYTKYFTLDPEMPLTIDVDITMHFSIILESMGYLLVDFHKNRKQHDYFIGYLAMIHKDMNLVRQDMSNFGVSLVEYLTVTFPSLMTPESQKIISEHVFDVIDKLSNNIEELSEEEFPYNPNSIRHINSSFVRWISCRKHLIYGKSTDFWSARKRMWEVRLEEWKRQMGGVKKPRKGSTSTDDDDDDDNGSPIRQSFDDNMSRSIRSLPRQSKAISSSRVSRQLLPNEIIETDINEPSVTLRVKKIGESQFNVVETINRNNEQFPNNLGFEFSLQNAMSSSSDESYEDISDKSSSESSENMTNDSPARQRRREKLSQ